MIPSVNLLRKITVNASTSLRRRNISIRHLAFALVLSIASLTLYYNYLRHIPDPFPADSIYYPPESPVVWEGRALQVRDAFLHAYHGYESFAFPNDELRPLSNRSIDR